MRSSPARRGLGRDCWAVHSPRTTTRESRFTLEAMSVVVRAVPTFSEHPDADNARDRFAPRAYRQPSPATNAMRVRATFAPDSRVPALPAGRLFCAFREHTSRARAARADPAGARQRHRSAPPAPRALGATATDWRRRGGVDASKRTAFPVAGTSTSGRTAGAAPRCLRGVDNVGDADAAARAGFDAGGSVQHRRGAERRGDPRDDLHHHRGQPGEDLDWVTTTSCGRGRLSCSWRGGRPRRGGGAARGGGGAFGSGAPARRAARQVSHLEGAVARVLDKLPTTSCSCSR